MPLDVCTPFGLTHAEAQEAVRLTTTWAAAGRDAWHRLDEEGSGRLFGIVQGNFFPDLRKRSAEELCDMDFPGYAIGGLSVGESFQHFCEYLSLTAPLLPGDRPRYLMGIGTPD